MELTQLLKGIQGLSNGPKLDKQQLMQDIISKNYEVLRTVLMRISSLYQFNEDLQKNIMNIQMKMNKISQDQQNIHYEMRVSQIALDSKLNNVAQKYNNLSNIRGNKSKKQIQSFEKRSAERQMSFDYNNSETDKQQARQEIQQKKQKQQTQQKSKKKEKPQKQQKIKQKIKKRQIKFKVQRQTQQPSNLIRYQSNREVSQNSCLINKQTSNRNSNVHEKDKQNFMKSSIHNKIKDDDSQTSNNNTDKNYEIISGQIKSQVMINRKTNLKTNTTYAQKNKPRISLSKYFVNQNFKSQHNLQLNKNNSDKYQKKNLQNILQQVQNYNKTNEKIRKNYQQLMEQYCKINSNNFNLIQDQIKEINSKINDQKVSTETFQKIKTEINEKIEILCTALSDKTQKQQFIDFVAQCNNRFQTLHEQRKNLARKDQTKKALQFLERKINKIIKDLKQPQNMQKLIHKLEVDQKGCFRIAEIHNEHQNLKDFNREEINNKIKILQHNNNSAWLYNTKRQAQSLHAKSMNGLFSQNRFNEDIQHIDRSFLKTRRQSPEGTLRAYTSTKNERNKQKVNELNRKSYDILAKQKKKIKRIKKQPGMIFQYD